jgi:hypothetical protein
MPLLESATLLNNVAKRAEPVQQSGQLTHPAWHVRQGMGGPILDLWQGGIWGQFWARGGILGFEAQ